MQNTFDIFLIFATVIIIGIVAFILQSFAKKYNWEFLTKSRFSNEGLFRWICAGFLVLIAFIILLVSKYIYIDAALGLSIIFTLSVFSVLTAYFLTIYIERKLKK